MEVKRKEVYILNGVEYRSITDIRIDTENKIGRIIDLADVTLSPKQKLHLLESMIVNKEELVKLLSIEIDMDPETLHGNMTNILDIKD